MLILLIVGCGLLFTGCDETIWPQCRWYTKVNSIVESHYVTIKNCTQCFEKELINCDNKCSRSGGIRKCSKSCDEICINSEIYTCYSSYAKFIGDNVTCLISVDTDIRNNNTLLQKLNSTYPIGYEHIVYFKRHNTKCSLGPTTEERNTTKFGLACLVVFGIVACCIGLLVYSGNIVLFKKNKN